MANGKEYSRRLRAFTSDPDLSGLDRKTRTDIGLELLARYAKPGVPLTRDDIAAWCGCTQEAIRRIEVLALRRVRKCREEQRAELRLEITKK